MSTNALIILIIAYFIIFLTWIGVGRGNKILHKRRITKNNKMKDINGVELDDNDQVIVNTKKGQSFQKVIVEDGKYFLIGVCKAPLTEQLIKEFKITKWGKQF